MSVDLEALVYQIGINTQKLSEDNKVVLQIVKDMSMRTQSELDATGKAAKDKLKGAFDETNKSAGLLSGGLMGVGIAGGVATAAVTAMTFALNQADGAMQWADKLQGTADNLDITAEALQRLEFAASQAGIGTSALDKGLEKLTGTLGAMQTGSASKGTQKAFAALGISEEQLKTVHDVSELLPLIADGMQNVGSRAAQVQIAKKLGIEALLPMLQGGADGLKDVGDEAESLGLVLDNSTVKSLKDLNEQTEIAQKRIDMQLKIAFLDLAPAIEGATTKFADFLQYLNKEMPSGQTMGGFLLKFVSGNYSGAIQSLMVPKITPSKVYSGTVSVDDIKRQFGIVDKRKKLPDLSDDPPRPKAPKENPLVADLDRIYAEGLSATEKAQKKYREDVEKLDAAFAQGLISDLQRQILLARLNVNLDLVVNPVAAKKEDVLGKYRDKEIDTEANVGERILKAVGPAKQAYNQLADLAEYSFARASGSADQFVDNFIHGIQRMAAEWASAQLGNFIFGRPDSETGDRSGGLLSNLFSGQRAGGGSVDAGRTYEVNENGREFFTPKVPGFITSNHDLQRMINGRDGNASQMSAAGNTMIMAPLLQLSAGGDVVSQSWIDSLNQKLRALHESAVKTATDQSRRSFETNLTRLNKYGKT